MKVQEVILRALAKRISWWPAAEILGFRIGVCGAGAALPRARLWRTVRAATREAESQAGAAGAGRGSVAALPEEGLRLERASLSREAAGGAWHRALYRDRGSHFFETPRAGGPADPPRLTPVGRALKEPGIPMIPPYSPQARGRSERRFGTWQGRLPPELRRAGIRTVEEANRFLTSFPEMNRKFSVPAAEKGEAFVQVQGQDLDRIFSVREERVVVKDNTVQCGESGSGRSSARRGAGP